MLALDDPRWSSLAHAYGSAAEIPELLRQLSTPREAIWEEVWSALCHQGSVYSATYAAVPHVVALGAARPASEQVDFWAFVGAVAASEDAPPIPEFLRDAYDAALARAREKIFDCLQPGVREADACWLFSSLASIDGQQALAKALEGLVDGELAPDCPGCLSELYITVSTVPFVLSDLDPVQGRSDRATRVVSRAPSPAVAELAQRARAVGLGALGARILALEGTVTCPVCGCAFQLIEEESS